MAAGTWLRKIRDAQDISAQAAADAMGVKVDRLRKWESRPADPRELDEQKVLAFFGIDSLEELESVDPATIDWTISNTEDINQQENVQSATDTSVVVLPVTSRSVRSPLPATNNSDAVLKAMNYKGYGVPIFDVDFACGMPDNSSAFMQAYEPIGWLDLPALRGCDALLFARSTSMLGLINPGDMVGVKRIYDYKSMMVYGKPYGIETSDFGIFKYVLRSKKKGNFLLSSENAEEYGDQEIPIRLIKKLWQVRAIVPLSQIKTF